MDRQPQPTITIVGAGIAGLVAAITAAQSGAHVVVHEAAPVVGGRARSGAGEWGANFGPHAVYGDGPVPGWLRSQGIAVRLVRPPATGFRVRTGGRLKRAPLPLVRAALTLTAPAPADLSFREWAAGRASPEVVDAAIGMASLPTFHADPGELSAAFVAQRLRRVTRRATSVRYVAGGWSTMGDALAAHARQVGVEIHTGSHVTTLPEPPVIVATAPGSAARLLGRELPAGQTRVALVDVGLSAVTRRAPFAVLDLDEHTYVARYSAADPSLAPAGAHLVQTSAPMRYGETHAAATERLRLALDAALPGWSQACVWRRGALAIDATGAVDAPGQTWRERPAIDQGEGVWLAGDYVAAPGMLSEVSWASAIHAAGGALTEALRPARRAWPVSASR